MRSQPIYTTFPVLFVLTACSSGSGSAGRSNAGLSGTWVVIHPVTNKTQLTINVSSAGFSVSTPDGERTGLILNSNGATYESRSARGELVTGISARVGGTASSYGAIPFSLSGAWSFVNPNKATDTPVAASINADAWSIGEVGSSARRSWSAARNSSATSMFGDLGGTWSVKQNNIDCVVTLADSNVRIVCADGRKSIEEFNATFDATSGIASGRAGDEEFVARRQ